MEKMIYVGFWLLLKRLGAIVEEYRSLGGSLWLNYGSEYEETLNACRAVSHNRSYYSRRDDTVYDSLEYVYSILYGACMSQDSETLNVDVPEHREIYLQWLVKMYKRHLEITTFEEDAPKVFGHSADFLKECYKNERAIQAWRKTTSLKEKYIDDDDTWKTLEELRDDISALSRM